MPETENQGISRGFLREVIAPSNRFTLRITMLAALGGFLFGYDTGVVGGALPLITQKLHLSSGEQSWVTGSLLLGAVSGALLSGFLADILGRRKTVFVAGCIYIVAALGSAFASDMLLLGIARGVLGLAVGTASFVAPMYIGEHSPKQLRGGMRDEARDVLARTRGEQHVDEEIDEIDEVAREEGRFNWASLLGGRIRPLLIVGLALAIAQQVIGINTVIYYGATILGFAGLSISSSIAQAVFIGLVNFVFAAVAVMLLDRVGRRPMLICGTIGTIIGLAVLGWYFGQSGPYQHHHAWIALVAMMFYIASFEISLGPVFWVMIAEIFPLRARAKAMAVCTMANWAFNFFVSYFFLDAVKALGTDGTFFMYAGLGVLSVLFFGFRVPETKGRSLETIEREIRGESARQRVRA